MLSEPLIYSISENAVTIEFGSAIDELLMQHISSFNQLLLQSPFPGLQDTIPAYTTLTVFFDPLIVFQSKELSGTSCFEKVSAYLQHLKIDDNTTIINESEPIIIPVCYGGTLGPDLEYVASYHRLTVDEVMQIHTNSIYKVYMIGFIPGFAYMGGLSHLLETPRRATPRAAVPAGAVGIAGKQTGIYPLETPGGWQIIGQTPLNLFDALREQPALLKAGDKVRFEAINLVEFEAYVSSPITI